jgi:hypothetical protein
LGLAAEARPLDRRIVITALGIAQILAWGTSFYFPAVFSEPIVAETGWSLGFVVGGTSIGLLTAGLISPQVGRMIDAHGGRPVLLASSLFYAAGLALVGFSYARPVYLLAWVLIGLGMGTGLYDAVFAALGRMYGSEARGPITNLTLFGGFASTICWPLSAFMIEHVGWRGACFIYAALHLLVMLPLQVSVVRAPRKPEVKHSGPDLSGETSRIHNETVIFALLAVVLSIAAGIGSIVVVHLLIFLQARGVRAGWRPCRRAPVWEPLSPDLDDDRLLHADGCRIADAVWRDTRACAGDRALRRRLRNFLDRTRHLAPRIVRPGAISAIDGQARVSEPHCSGGRTFSGSASHRGERLERDHRCIDAACADQCGADRRALVVVPEALYRWLRTGTSARSFCPLCAELSEMARPSKVRANILMAKRIRIMARFASGD